MSTQRSGAVLDLNTRPVCPFCNVARLSVLLFIVCAYCKKAWHPFEFEHDLRALDTKARP